MGQLTSSSLSSAQPDTSVMGCSELEVRGYCWTVRRLFRSLCLTTLFDCRKLNLLKKKNQTHMQQSYVVTFKHYVDAK